MNSPNNYDISERMLLGIQLGAIRALTEHKKAGQCIAIWRDGKVVVVPPEEIEIPEAPEIPEELRRVLFPQKDK